jgi:RNase P subunit RPR2
MKRETKMRNDFAFKNGELFQRMNYLLELASELYDKHPILSKFYIHSMKDMRKRNALRMDGKLKKLICKCNNLLFRDKETKIELKSRI